MKQPAAAWLLAAALLFAAAAVLCPVDGQGLSVDAGTLGAGEKDVVDQFDKFEAVLELSGENTGGRGRGNRGTTSSKTGSAFKTVASFQEQQDSLYAISGSPKVWYSDDQSPKLLARVRDQGDCDTCVAYAIAAAIEASYAAVTGKSARDVEINPQSLYYCSKGGTKTCKTGWDLEDALQALADPKQQYLIRPSSCVPLHLKDAVNEPLVLDFSGSCQQAKDGCSKGTMSDITDQKPWLSCKFKSLSSFTAIQRHIRQYGAVISRISIYSDFEPYFNATRYGGTTVGRVKGKDYSPYNKTRYYMPPNGPPGQPGPPTAKLLFGHAAVIVGYNNTAPSLSVINGDYGFSWLMLNSWGYRTTLDGLFRIQMGLAGVAVPEQTFGMVCTPFPGSQQDLHSTPWLKPWLNESSAGQVAKNLRRRPVEYWSPNDQDNVNTSLDTCYKYNREDKNESITDIASAFAVDLRRLVKDNIDIFELQTVNGSLNTGTTWEELTKVAQVLMDAGVHNVSRSEAVEPRLVCRTRKEGDVSPGKPARCTLVKKDGSRGDDLRNCIGSWSCRVFYSEPDLSKPVLRNTLKVCNPGELLDIDGQFDRVAVLKSPRDSQARAIKVLLEAAGLAPSISNQLEAGAAAPYCSRDKWGLRNPDATAFDVSCDNDGYVTKLTIALDSGLDLNNTGVAHALLILEKLKTLSIRSFGGMLAPQLGALKHLETLSISASCKEKNGQRADSGPLPSNWLAEGEQGHWRSKLKSLTVNTEPGCKNQVITGASLFPEDWVGGDNSASPLALETLDLGNNRFAGRIPDVFEKMPNLKILRLANNVLTGPVPASLAALSRLERLNLKNNRLSGPSFFDASNLTLLDFSSNQGLSGCVTPASSLLGQDINLEQTSVKLCNVRLDTWPSELNTLNTTFKELFLAAAPANSDWAAILANLSGQLPKTRMEYYQSPQRDGTAMTFTASAGSRRSSRKAAVVADTQSKMTLTTKLTDVGNPFIAEVQAIGPAINLAVLPKLLSQLSRLDKFTLSNCKQPGSDSNPVAGYQLPRDLSTLRYLEINTCQLTGVLPNWSNWTVQILNLPNNRLSGPLPAWSGLTALIQLDLTNNLLTGELPAEWATSFSSKATDIKLARNTGIIGAVPSAWTSQFSNTQINLGRTNVSGCRPAGLNRLYAPTLESGLVCGETEMAALSQAKELLVYADSSLQDYGKLASWQTWKYPWEGESPVYCSGWQGISCTGTVITAIDLSSLGGSNRQAASLGELLRALRPLSGLRTLRLGSNPQLFQTSAPFPPASTWAEWPKLEEIDLSNAAFSSPTKPADVLTALSSLTSLKVLKLQGNTGLFNGELPAASHPAWAAWKQLQHLNLSGTGLTGRLPAWSNALPGLQILHLQTNKLTGPLPIWPGFTSLTDLDVSNCQLASQLPEEWNSSLSANISSINLAGNQGINGSIPKTFWNYFTSTRFNLTSTSITGCLPAAMQGLIAPQLQNAPRCGEAEANALLQLKDVLLKADKTLQDREPLSTWTVPPTGTGAFYCQNWQGVACDKDNQLTSLNLTTLGDVSGSTTIKTVLDAIKPLTRLQILLLQNNPQLFQGSTVPTDGWSTWPNLQQLDLSDCDLGGTPAGNLTEFLQGLKPLQQLQQLKLRNNPQLFTASCMLPSEIWSAWPKLQALDLSNCAVSGYLPEGLGDLGSLRELLLSNNPGLTGPLPQNLIATPLSVLDLLNCSLNGPLPASYAALPLQILRIGPATPPDTAEATISGPLPPQWGIIDTLQQLVITNTYVSGPIPAAWFDPAEKVSPAAAQFEPAAAAAGAPSDTTQKDEPQAAGTAALVAQALQRVADRLSSRSSMENVDEVITPAVAPAGNGQSMMLLEVLDLSGNSGLTGPLPEKLSASTQLRELNLAGNQLNGTLPDSYSRLSKLQTVNLSHNLLNGSIPVTWTGLRSLKRLDLSSNPSFGGAVPQQLYLMSGPSYALRCLALYDTGLGDYGSLWSPESLAVIKSKFEASGRVTVAIDPADAQAGGCSSGV